MIFIVKKLDKYSLKNRKIKNHLILNHIENY